MTAPLKVGDVAWYFGDGGAKGPFQVIERRGDYICAEAMSACQPIGMVSATDDLFAALTPAEVEAAKATRGER